MNLLALPGQTIGILGGGQLGRMTILEGRKMGYRFITLDPQPDSPAGQVADHQIIAAFNDHQAAAQLAEQSDLILYEFENIAPELVQFIEKRKPVPQGSRLLMITQHRLYEKQALAEADVPIAPYDVIHTEGDLQKAAQEIGTPGVLKTALGGYDGKGQWLIQSPADVPSIFREAFVPERLYIYEQFVPFIKEISMVIARNKQGEVQAFPPTLNLHRDHILHMVVAPAMISESQRQQAEEIAICIADYLQVVGMIAVEMFVLADGRIWVNEIAPRPHNSGHYTIDACQISQFAQFLRAVLGYPLQLTTQMTPAVMLNLLGEHVPQFLQQLPNLPPSVKVHWYGKKEARPGRKMGHLTVLADQLEEAIELAEQIPIWSPLTAAEKQAMITSDTE